MARFNNVRWTTSRISFPIFFLCLTSSVLANWENGPNVGNDPFKNVNGFNDPFTNFKAPEPRLDVNDQRPDLISRESPNSYRDGFAESRQFPESSFGGNQFGSNSPFGQQQQQQQFGVPDMRQLGSNVENPNIQFPNFQEPNFNLPNQNIGGGNLMNGPGGFGGGNLGNGWQQGGAEPFAQQPMGPVGAGQFNVPGMQGGAQPFAQQPMGPVGAGQFNVPGMQAASNPLQQISFGSNQDFSGQPIYGLNNPQQPGPQPFFTANGPSNFGQNNFQPQQSQNNFGQEVQNQNVPQFQDQNNQQQPQQQEQQNQDQFQNQNNQGMVGSVKVVPIEQFHQGELLPTNQDSQQTNGQENQGAQQINQENVEKPAVTESSEPLRVPEGLKAKPAGMPDCGFHGMESWQKSPCETCTCDKGITKCDKVKCSEKPENSSCIPIYHFTTCCPTYQCSGNGNRGFLPTIEQTVREGDSCKKAGEFVPTSTSTPCSACKCNDKLRIQCTIISCPPRPSDVACRERLPKNPTVCCAEFDCPKTKGSLNVTSFKPQSVALDTSDDTDDADSGSESSGRNAFGNAGSVLTSDDALASTEQPIVVVEETTTIKTKATKRIQPKRTITRTTTTTEEPDYTDAEDETATTSAPRPKGAALVSENSAADLPRLQLIRAQDSATVQASTTTTSTTKASTTQQTAKSTAKSTTKSQAVPTAENPSAERGAIHDCQGGWKYPAGCDVSKDCTYVARWKQLPAEQSVRFKITTRDADKWTGIGFTKNKNFDNVDMVVGWVDKSSKILIQDRHGSAHQPELDQQQTMSNLRGSRMGNVTTIEFTRRQKSHDLHDVIIDDENCPYFVFPVKAGAYDTFTQKIQSHVEDPEISDVGVCITKCTDGAAVKQPSEVPTGKTTRQPTQTATTTSKNTKTAAADNGSKGGDDSATTSVPAAKNAAAVSGDTGGSCAVEGAVLSLNPCQNCTCQNGIIQCVNINCRDSFTQHFGCVPSFKVGVCCPEWQCPNRNTTQSAAPTLTRSPGTGRRGSAQSSTTTAARAVAVPQNSDKLLILSKKQFNGNSNEEETNSGLDQLPDRMGVVTPPSNWSSDSTTLETDSATLAPIEVHADVDVCLNHPCGNNATCIVVGAGIPGCVCKTGFEGDANIACLKPNVKPSKNACSTVKCGLNARCYDIDGQPQCKCESGFSGDPMFSCDTEIHGGFIQPAECQLRSEIGGCQNFGMRWQFDSRISGCRQFVYSGCAGNDNNFVSRLQCEQRCVPQKRFYRDKPCDSDTDFDSQACARCECTDAGFITCTPVSCGAPPNKDCRAIPQSGECCPKYDCTILPVGNSNSSDAAGSVGMTNTKSDVCSGVTCHEPAFKAGCVRVKLPGDCCPTIQCGGSNASDAAAATTEIPTLNLTTIVIQNSSVQLPGVPCSSDDKISSSNPCLSCQCINGSTTCSQVICPPITPDQRRRCRITQLANQCCLSVECTTPTRSPSTLRTPTAEVVSATDDSATQTSSSTVFQNSLLENGENSRDQRNSTTLATVTSTSPVTSTASSSTKTVATSTTAASTRVSSTNPQSTSTTKKTSSSTLAVTGAVVVVNNKGPGCSEAADGGVCRATITRWFYNPVTSKCETFVYSGCGGNKNRYLTEERCKSSCK